MKIKGIDNRESKVPTKVYDVEKKQLIGVFESRKDAANFLGVSTGNISTAFKFKSKIHTNKLGITVCIR